MTSDASAPYPARLAIDYPDRDLDRLSTFLRIFYIIPIAIVLSLIGSGGSAIVAPTLLLILFREKYPRWWFDFNREITRFSTRIWTYGALLSDEYPSTTDEQWVRLELDYPDAKEDLNRWLPLVKWILAIPHYIVLIVLSIAAFLGVIVAWFAILFTGRYPRGIFDFVVGVMRWGLRVNAYAFLLITDKYPPFSLS